MTDSPVDQVYTVAEAAVLLRTPPYVAHWVRQLCITNRIGRKIGRDRLLDDEDLKQLHLIVSQDRRTKKYRRQHDDERR